MKVVDAGRCSAGQLSGDPLKAVYVYVCVFVCVSGVCVYS